MDTVLSYDAAGRPNTVRYADGATVSYQYDANGNRVVMVDTRGVTQYSYDALDRVVSITHPDGQLVSYQYDQVGRRTALTYPDGTTVTYQYDPAGRLVAVSEPNGQTLYTYDAATNLTGIVYPNATAATLQYDAAKRLIRVTHRSATAILADISYTLDRAGNRIAVNESGRISRYVYDALQQLTSVTLSNGLSQTYQYDAVGNRTRLTAGSTTETYTYDAANRLLSAGNANFSYDANGNILTKTQGPLVTRYSFDAANRLRAVARGATTSTMSYDGDGNRVATSGPTGVNNFLLDPLARYPLVLSETGQDGAIRYTYGVGLISGTSPTFRHTYHPDGLGSTRLITDQTRVVRGRLDYTPWGQLQGAVDPLGSKAKFKFAGEQFDQTTGLYYLRARYFDPSVGRFIAADPSRRQRRDYRYADNNPVNFGDPSGLLTYAVGLSASAVFGLGASGNAMLVYDDKGNSGLALTTSVSAGWAAGVSLKGIAVLTNANTIDDLVGPGYSLGVAGGALGVAEFRVLLKKNGEFGGIMYGAGVGAELGVTGSFGFTQVMLRNSWLLPGFGGSWATVGQQLQSAQGASEGSSGGLIGSGASITVIK